MTDPWDILKTLADPTRMRLLLLLREEELSVAELQEILEMGQSRISSHLAVLRNTGLVEDRKEGKHTFYSLRAAAAPKNTRPLIQAAFDAVEQHPEVKRDKAELHRVIQQRRALAERYFNDVAGRLGRNYCPGRSWEAVCQFLLYLTPHIDIADLGAGEGLLAHLMAKRARSVYCVDNSPRMVEVGTGLAAQYGFQNLQYKLGDIEAIPLEGESVDLAYFSQALHHAEHPPRALAESYRILRKGGRVLVIDLKEHSFEKARELYADRWLGFRESALHQMLREAGYQHVEVRTVAKEEKEPYFETLLASGVKD